MPKKYFHIVNCPLSKRQRYLYEDYIGRRKTKEQLASGSFLSMMGVLMQLRKVCNHPDLFETRPITSPFITPNLTVSYPKCIFIEDLTKVHSHSFNQCYLEVRALPLKLPKIFSFLAHKSYLFYNKLRLRRPH